MFQISLNLNIKQEESVFVVEQNTKIRLKVNPKDKKGKITRCVICDLTALAKKCPHQSNYNVINVLKSLSEIEHKAICDEEVINSK